MGYLDYIDTPPKKQKARLSGTATKLLKEAGYTKKTRRGSGAKKKAIKQAEHNRLMEQYKKQKRARGQMFADFKRLITS